MRWLATLAVTAAAAFAALLAGVPTGVVAEVALALAVLAVTATAAGSARPDRFEELLAARPSGPAERPDRLARQVEVALTSGHDLHRVLRPVLARIADERLRDVRVAPGSTEAARLLGPELAALLARPRGRQQPAWTPAQLADALDRLARIGAVQSDLTDRAREVRT